VKKLFLLLIILLPLGLAACNNEEYANDEDYVAITTPPPDAPVATGFADDVLALAMHMRRNHIGLQIGIFGDNATALTQRQAIFAEIAEETDDLNEFLFAMQWFLTPIGDTILNSYLLNRIIGNEFIGVNLQADIDRNMIYVPDGNRQLQVLSIGGLYIADLSEVAQSLSVFANVFQFTRELPAILRSVAFLEYVHAETDNGAYIVVLLYGDERIELRAYPRDDSFERLAGITPAPNFIIHTEMIDNIMGIVFPRFERDPAIAIAESAIAMQVERGNTDFILDLRGSIGGDLEIAAGLIRAMGIQTPLFYSVRFTLPGVGDTSEHIRSNPITNPNDVRIAVLTDVNTRGEALRLAAWIQDLGFGLVIGEPPAASPSDFIRPIYGLTLPYSGITLYHASLFWMRPGRNVSPTVLMPNIRTHAGLALSTALDFFADTY